MTPPDPRRRSERSRSAILNAALELCAESDYNAVTVEAIAARAGVSKKTIYRWWPSKSAVVLVAIDETVRSDLSFPDTGDLAADLRTQIQNVVTMYNAPIPGKALKAVLGTGLHDAGMAEMLHQIHQPRIDQFNERLRSAVAVGQLPEGTDPKLAVELLYGPLYHRMLLSATPLHSIEEVAELVSSVLAALRNRNDE